VGRRPPGKPLAGYWEFPGGHARRSETPQAAAVRECLEETGLEVVVTGRYPETQYEYAHGRVHLHFFACRPVDPHRTPLPPFHWVPREQLAKLQFPEANRRLLTRLAGGEASAEQEKGVRNRFPPAMYPLASRPPENGS
jgi:8-oxo-dGTP diphosphatase